MTTQKQLAMFIEEEIAAENEKAEISNVDTASTFLDNMKMPVHRWFRYSAGYSAEWAKNTISKFAGDKNIVLLDPFVGSGTSLLAAQESGAEGYGIEAHPFVYRVAQAKMYWTADNGDFDRFVAKIVALAATIKTDITVYPDLIRRCFPDDTLTELDTLRRSWEALNDRSPSSELCWLAITSILRISSPVGTSQMELIQPKKSKQRSVKPMDAFIAQVAMVKADIIAFKKRACNSLYHLAKDDARVCSSVQDDTVDLVITSPPYINNFDYADATRLEMSFWGDVKGWGDLQNHVRKYLVRSCAQHMKPRSDNLEALLENPAIAPIGQELREVCLELARERLEHNGKKNYHLMTAAYFVDLARVWGALRRVCRADSNVCFVVGDSAPYGVYVPVHDWLGRLAVANGFRGYQFEKTRDRNVKWKNRKHRVPLIEGRLWVDG